METEIHRSLVGSSLFFYLSNTEQKFGVKIIDFTQIFPLAAGEFDTGFIKGIKSLLYIFGKIIKQEERAQKIGPESRIKSNPDGTLLKFGKRKEIKFYQDSTNPHSKYYEDLLLFKAYLPVCFGIAEENGQEWIKLANIFYGLEKASFMDFKMGDTLYTEEDSLLKIQNKIKLAKNSTSYEYGFSLTSLEIKNRGNNLSLCKQFNEFTYDKIANYATKFLLNEGSSDINREAKQYFITTMKKLLEIFESKNKIKFTSSHLLFIFSRVENKCFLQMNNFVHTCPLSPSSKDSGYIKGLKSLIEIFEKIV